MNETLILAIPVYDKVHCEAWKADMVLTYALAKHFDAGSLAFAFQHGLPQPHAQNMLIRDCLKQKMPSTGKRPDWILWVEGDTLPPMDSFTKLRTFADPEKAPVIHGLSCDRVYPHGPSAWRFGRDADGNVKTLDPLLDWKPDTLYKVDHSGTCLTLFHTSVFDRLKEPWFRMRPFLQGDYKGAQCCLSLSARFHGAGIPMYVYTGCLVPHMSAEIPVTPNTIRDADVKLTSAICRPISAYAEELQKEFSQSTTSIS